MSQDDDLRIVLRDPDGFEDHMVSHPGQPQPYIDDRGTSEQTDGSTNWRLIGNVHLRVYDLVKRGAKPGS